MLILPMVLTSIQTAIEAPGLPLGFAKISPGWKKKLFQGAIIIFSPITILLLRLQYQLTFKKWEKLQELQDEKKFDEFSRLTSLLMIMQNQQTKRIKMDLAFEVANEIFIGALMVAFASSQTKTTTGLESLFQIEGDLEIRDIKTGLDNYDIFIGSTVVSFLSFLKSYVRAQADNWPLKSKILVAFHGFVNLAMRTIAMLVFFTPSLGLVNILRHYQAERVPFDKKYHFEVLGNQTLYFGHAPPVPWQDITRVNYSDTNNPTPPDYRIYTGLFSKDFLIIFGCLWIHQIFAIWLHNYLRSKAFKTMSGFDQIMHAFQSVVMPAPSVDWADGVGDCKEHFDRMKGIQKEVIGMITINAIFNILHLLPITYLGKLEINMNS